MREDASAERTLVELAVALDEGQFDALIAALRADLELLATLGSDEGQFPVFAPTDSAFNGAGSTATDFEASNGVLHVIDGVLLPPCPCRIAGRAFRFREISPGSRGYEREGRTYSPARHAETSTGS